MHYIMENLIQYDLSDEDVVKLKALGFICDGDGTGHPLEVAAFVWDDLGLEGEATFDLFDRILGRKGGA